MLLIRTSSGLFLYPLISLKLSNLMMVVLWFLFFCLSQRVNSLFIQSLNSSGDTSGTNTAGILDQSAAHQRIKRWGQYGNRVWNDTIKIGFSNYSNAYSKQDQDRILRECTQVSYLPYSPSSSYLPYSPSGSYLPLLTSC